MPNEARLDVADFYALTNLAEEGLQGLEAFRSQQHRDVVPQRLLRRIAEQGDRPRIPALDQAVNARHEDGVFGRRDDGRDQLSEFVGAIGLGHK